jgi:hypothetical protein
VNDGDRKKQVDNDILQSKADILRAQDIIPGKGQADNKASDAETKQAQEETSPPEPALADQQEPEVPQFDLAERIMAEQRKVTAVRRKGPGEKAEAESRRPQAKLAEHTVEPPPAQSNADGIIAEIVARDIERLCRGGSSADSG